MGHPIHRFSAIARPVEPQYPTNLAILLVMGACAIGLGVTALARGASATDAGLAGLTGALMVFATWALARDLAPDDNPAAFVALIPIAVVVGLGSHPPGLSQLPAALLTIGLVRVVNRSVGPPAKLTDQIAVIVMLGLVVRDEHTAAAGLAAVLAFGLDAVLVQRHPRGWIFAGLAVLATVVGIATADVLPSLATPGPWTIAAIAVAGLFGVVIATQPPPRAEADVSAGGPLRRDRVQGGMLVGLVAAAGSLVGGDAAVQAWGVVWAAMAGVVLTRPLLARTSP